MDEARTSNQRRIGTAISPAAAASMCAGSRPVVSSTSTLRWSYAVVKSIGGCSVASNRNADAVEGSTLSRRNRMSAV
jgi:hypothetical protein